MKAVADRTTVTVKRCAALPGPTASVVVTATDAAPGATGVRVTRAPSAWARATAGADEAAA